MITERDVMKICNHLIGFIEHDRYDCISTEFQFIDDVCLKTLTTLKEVDKDTIFNFCPKCGVNLDNIITLKIKELQKQQDEILQEKNLKLEKDKLMFNNKYKELGSETNLDKLSDSETFCVLFYPTQRSYDKDHLIYGSKEDILSTMTRYAIANHEVMKIKSIIKNLESKKLEKILTDCGWLKLKDNSYERKEVDTITTLDYDTKGKFYISTKTKISTEDDTYWDAAFNSFSTISLEKFLGVKIDLESIKLKSL